MSHHSEYKATGNTKKSSSNPSISRTSQLLRDGAGKGQHAFFVTAKIKPVQYSRQHSRNQSKADIGTSVVSSQMYGPRFSTDLMGSDSGVADSSIAMGPMGGSYNDLDVVEINSIKCEADNSKNLSGSVKAHAATTKCLPSKFSSTHAAQKTTGKAIRIKTQRLPKKIAKNEPIKEFSLTKGQLYLQKMASRVQQR
mmetsp:Transcript_14156/g.15614  ORF Transcript_14156/g.15614 Transcript_14156/m.15614 type:complete len:196 (-) Transcript_14156:41-628(-)